MSDDVNALHVPHLCPVEVTHALRGLVRSARFDADRAAAALEDLADFPATRHAAEHLLPRIWQLRDTMTVYDATYVALAESLDAPLLTTDEKTARTYRHSATVELIS
jgi:predicted nucleic acid-binding protein